MILSFPDSKPGITGSLSGSHSKHILLAQMLMGIEDIAPGKVTETEALLTHDLGLVCEDERILQPYSGVLFWWVSELLLGRME